MEKILGLVLIIVYALWYFTVQGNTSTKIARDMPSVTQESHAIVEEHVSHSELSQNEMAEVIKKVGEENGWIMTDFKSNAIIAEKITEKETISVTVSFSSSSFDIIPANDELRKALQSML